MPKSSRKFVYNKSSYACGYALCYYVLLCVVIMCYYVLLCIMCGYALCYYVIIMLACGYAFSTKFSFHGKNINLIYKVVKIV